MPRCGGAECKVEGGLEKSPDCHSKAFVVAYYPTRAGAVSTRVFGSLAFTPKSFEWRRRKCRGWLALLIGREFSLRYPPSAVECRAEYIRKRYSPTSGGRFELSSSRVLLYSFLHECYSSGYLLSFSFDFIRRLNTIVVRPSRLFSYRVHRAIAIHFVASRSIRKKGNRLFARRCNRVSDSFLNKFDAHR